MENTRACTKAAPVPTAISLSSTRCIGESSVNTPENPTGSFPCIVALEKKESCVRKSNKSLISWNKWQAQDVSRNKEGESTKLEPSRVQVEQPLLVAPNASKEESMNQMDPIA